MTLEIIPLTGIGVVRQDDNVAEILAPPIQRLAPKTGDVLVVTHKIVSKAEGAVRAVVGDPEEFKRSLVEEVASSIVRRRGDLIIAETRHGFVCANAGIDRSNAEEGTMILLPEDPDRSAHRIRRRLEQLVGIDLPVIISDTFGRPWRTGYTEVAIGVAGMQPIIDYVGTTDAQGRELKATWICVADELASAAELVTGKVNQVPVSLIRGYAYPAGEGSAQDMVRQAEMDMFR